MNGEDARDRPTRMGDSLFAGPFVGVESLDRARRYLNREFGLRQIAKNHFAAEDNPVAASRVRMGSPGPLAHPYAWVGRAQAPTSIRSASSSSPRFMSLRGSER